MSIASVAAQQSAASTTTAASGNTQTTTANPLASLSNNFGDFLNLLMTQLRNQDPTTPLNTDQFTSELVQFSGVEQQIQANTSLSQLIQLTQAGEIMQSSAMVGKQVAVTSDHLSLQNGSATFQFTGTADEPVAISIFNDAGTKLSEADILAQKGQNSWTWDGTDSSGNTVPDGSYKVVVTGASGTTPTPLPFTVLGTATGVQKQGNSMQVQLGALGVDFGSVQSVGP